MESNGRITHQETKNWDLEYNLLTKGYNPLFGEQILYFQIEPKCYQSKFKTEFITLIQDRFRGLHYYFTNEVQVLINLRFNEQKRYATPDIGDLDNYAKVICDSLKGVNGIIVDDTQIQSLGISWIDTCKKPEFQILIKSLPDDFRMKPLILVEMPDRLFYPLSQTSWTKNGPEKVADDAFFSYVDNLKALIHKSNTWRHELRESGSNQNEAYYKSRGISPDIRGYHKNRILDAGFDIVYL